MASEEKTARAITFGIRWCSCWSDASGRPTSTRFTMVNTGRNPTFGGGPARRRQDLVRVGCRGRAAASAVCVLAQRAAQNAGMHIVILGCGRTGSQLALSLDEAGHSVAIVDRDRDAFNKRLSERFTGRAV